MKRIVVILILFVAALALGRFVVWPLFDDSAADENGALTVYGNVEIRQVDLAFRVAGRLQEILFEEGDTVAAGVVVARLDPVSLEDSLLQADAEATARKAELALLVAGSRPQEIARGKAQVDELEAAVTVAQQTFDRHAALMTKGFVSRQAYDNALAVLNGAKNRRDAARQELAITREGPRREQIDAARAAYEASQANVAQLQTKLSDASLVAQSDGILLSRVREPGSIVQAGTTIATLALTRPVWVRAYVKEADLGRAAPGTPVEIFTDSRPDQAYQGQVGFVSPVAEFTPKTVQTPDLRSDLVYQIRIVIAKPDSGLRQGMPVTARIEAPASVPASTSAR